MENFLLQFPGNGPSGISLSYMLAGNWPYWLPNEIDKHPDELLRARLNYADGDKSLIEQNLFELADGLEGRSTNPVSLLVRSDLISRNCCPTDFGVSCFSARQPAKSVRRPGHGSALYAGIPPSTRKRGVH
jgi:hypothetical protein